MLSTLAVIAIVSFQGQRSLFRELVPKPTGQNGYEEYLMACDALRASQATSLVSAEDRELKAVITAYESPTTPMKPSRARYDLARRLLGTSVLQIRREAVSQASRALDLVIQGNKKPVYDPRETVSWGSGYGEMSHFRVLGKLFQVAAYVSLADSQPSRAALFIAESIRFGQRLSGLRLNARYNALVVQGFAFESVEQYLTNLGGKDAALLEGLVRELLSQRPSIFQVIENDLAGVKEYYREMLTLAMRGAPHAEDADAAKFIKRMTVAELDQTLELVGRIVAQRKQILIAHFQRPESAWVAPAYMDATRGGTVNSVNSLAEMLADNYRPGLATIGKHEATNRTQLRLVGLAAAVMRFRWENDRFPASLAELSPARDVNDPLSGSQFQYELVGNGFRVYSRGAKETGEIGLKYTSPTKEEAPPPYR